MEEHSFKDKVFSIVQKIPPGKTLTYKEVARLAGRPKAFRAVGNILHSNFDLHIPCHRVIRSDGKMGGYNRGGTTIKEHILEQERQTAMKP